MKALTIYQNSNGRVVRDGLHPTHDMGLAFLGYYVDSYVWMV